MPKQIKSIKKMAQSSVETHLLNNDRSRIDRKDLLIMSVMTILYLIIALINLGSFRKIPQTSWKPNRAGEYVTLDLGQRYPVSGVSFYYGTGEGQYQLEYLDDSNQFVNLGTIAENESSSLGVGLVKFTVPTSCIRITAAVPGKVLKEIGIYEGDDYKLISGIKVVDQKTDTGNTGVVKNLLDEQDKLNIVPVFLNSAYFDETLYVRTAAEYLQQREPYEKSHPPLGILLISLGMALFGNCTFGWRICGTVFGAALIPIMYLFGKKLFEKRLYGFYAAFLMMFDFMHFSHTRIATNDVFVVVFIVLMFYFMYQYIKQRSYLVEFKKSLQPLFFSGLFFGLGMATKWFTIYGGMGLAFLLLFAKNQEYHDYLRLTGKKSVKAPWIKDFIPLYLKRTFLFCGLFFVIVPALIYILAYIPMMTAGQGFSELLQNQLYIWGTHTHLPSQNYVSSPWWSWPFNVMPLKFDYAQNLPAEKASAIVSMGNPAIWWFGIVAVLMATVITFKKRDRGMALVLVALIFQYFTWAFIQRFTYIYHFFSAVPFLILAIVYVLKHLNETYPTTRFLGYLYLGVVAGLFIMFYPVLSGMVVDKTFIERYLMWFKDWNFIKIYTAS